MPADPLPSDLSDDSITSFQLIAFNEMFEVAFFSELVENITNEVDGYQFNQKTSDVLDTLSTVLAVEELHALGANSILQANDIDPIEPCEYNFPVSDFQSAIALASTFTVFILGALQDASGHFSQDSEGEAINFVSSVTNQESEHEHLFRAVRNKTTSEGLFIGTGTRDLTFSAVQRFIVPGSCPNIEDIPLETFKPLNVLTEDIKPEYQYLTLSFDASEVDIDINSLSAVIVNGPNTPIMKEMESIDAKDAIVTFQLEFPFNDHPLYGLTMVALTHSAESFGNANDVAAQTVFGPGLIEID